MENKVCPAIFSPLLDNPFRRLIHNPYKILKGLINPGDTAIDIGCGPGVFTIPMAKMVGKDGKVIAVDIQDKMLEIVNKKAINQKLDSRIQTQKCDASSLCVKTKADFVLTFYMVHEVPDQERFLKEVTSLLMSGSKYLLVEPEIHVRRSDFEKEVEFIISNGLRIIGKRKVLFSRAILFTK